MFIVNERQLIESSFRSDMNIALLTERRLLSSRVSINIPRLTALNELPRQAVIL